MKRYFVGAEQYGGGSYQDEDIDGDWVKYEDAQAAIQAAVLAERDSFRAVGWIRADGTMHKGCPPLGEPGGWTVLYQDNTEGRSQK